MGRPSRKIIAVNMETGERREFAQSKDCAGFLGVDHSNIRQAVERNGVCRGWRLYDAPDTLRDRIGELERQLAEIEA